MTSLSPVRPRLGVVALGLLLAAALGVRLWQIEQKNVWLDEASAWTTASRPLPQLVETTAGDVHPPLYYLVLKAWMRVAGDSPAALRGLSAIFGVTAMLLAWLLARRWLSRGTALLVVAWMAISPHMVWHAQEMRMYAFATMLVLACCLAFWQWIESDGERRAALLLFVGTATAALWAHYFTSLVLAALWVYVALASYSRRGLWRPWLWANVVIVLCYLPWLPTAVAQMTRGQSWREPVIAMQIPGYAALFLKEMLVGPHYGLSPALGAASLALTTIAALGWLFLAVRQAMTWRVDDQTFLLVVCAVPSAVTLALLPVSGQMQVSRYLAYLTPLVFIAAARGWSGLSRRAWTAVPAVAVAVAASSVWLAAYFRDTEKDVDLRPAAAVVMRDWSAAHANGAAQGAVVSISGTTIPLRYLTRTIARLNVVDVWEIKPVPRAVDAAIAAARGGPAWLVVDPRWPEFKTFNPADDPRLTELDVPNRGRTRARVFRAPARLRAHSRTRARVGSVGRE